MEQLQATTLITGGMVYIWGGRWDGRSGRLAGVDGTMMVVSLGRRTGFETNRMVRVRAENVYGITPS